jgi:hypothetical protein
MFVLLLTNRVHAARALRPAKVIADVRADLADAAELAVLDDPMGMRAMPAAFRADEASGWNNRPARTVSRGKARKASGKATRAKSARGSKSAKRAKSSSAKSSSAKSSSAKSSSKKSTAKSSSAKRSTSKSAKSAKSAKSTKRVRR